MSIVAGVSDTPFAAIVVQRALEEAQLRSTSVLLASNVSAPRSREDALGYGESRSSREAWLDELADEVRQRADVPVDTYLPATPGELSEAILEAAAQPGAELIVIGIPRRSRVGKAVIGSTSQEVLLGSDLPVLGVKLPRDQEP